MSASSHLVIQRLEERLEALKQGCGIEFRECLKNGARPLEKLERLGGDPNFVMFVLAGYRWRIVGKYPHWLERRRVVKAIDRILPLSLPEWLKETLRRARSGLTY